MNNTENPDEVFKKLKKYEGQFLKIKIKKSDECYITIKGIFDIVEDKYYKLFHGCNCQWKDFGVYSELVGYGNYGIISMETQEGLCVYNNPFIFNSKLSGIEMIALKFGEEGKKRYNKYLNEKRCNY